MTNEITNVCVSTVSPKYAFLFLRRVVESCKRKPSLCITMSMIRFISRNDNGQLLVPSTRTAPNYVESGFREPPLP